MPVLQEAPAVQPMFDLPVFDTPQSWRGEDVARRQDWIHQLNAGETAETERRVRHADEAAAS